MLRKLSRRLTYANVMSTIAVFGVLAGGTAYAANTVFSADIVDGEVASVDIKNQDILSADVKDQSLTTFDVSTFLGADIVDGTLTAKDVGENSYTFEASIPPVPAHSCTSRQITGIQADGDHMVLTPRGQGSTDSRLMYSMEHQLGSSGDAAMKICNPTVFDIDNTTTFFNLIVLQH